ncbi:phosphohydrolase [Geobacillus stearothermophilus 10]|nr:phosphohydrolase [Geobacillus stearothermophilus 10]
MRTVTLTDVFAHPIAQKYLKRSGLVHAITAAYHAYHLALRHGVNVDLATKAALLHDIGHYTWYKNGRWDYEQYRQNDIHAIKGAERAHKLLIRLGEHPQNAKEIALAILLHTDSYLPEGEWKRTPLQAIVKWADEADEEPGGRHHYRTISDDLAWKKIRQLDELVSRQHGKERLGDIV